MKKENLSGSYDDGEVFILANDPKHSKRKQKMRNLDEKPEETTIKSWSKKKKAFWMFLFITITSMIIYGFNNITNLSPPL